MRTNVLLMTLALLGAAARADAQQIKASKMNLQVGDEVTVQLDRGPGHNESVSWTILSGDGGQLLGDMTGPTVTFRAEKAGTVVVVCVINAPGVPQRRPGVTLTITGSALQPPQPAPAASPAAKPAPPPPALKPPVAHATGTLALEAIDHVVPAGWMGDAMSENNGTAMLDSGHTTGCRSQSCYRVEYKPGKVGWAAFAWQVVPAGSMNWGEYRGANLSAAGYQSLRLWVRGELGASAGMRPRAQFKSGGNVAPTFSDSNPASYTVAGPTVELTADWTEYCLDLAGKDLSNVVSPLTVVLTKASNPNNATILVDDVAFSTSACPR